MVRWITGVGIFVGRITEKTLGIVGDGIVLYTWLFHEVTPTAVAEGRYFRNTIISLIPSLRWFEVTDHNQNVPTESVQCSIQMIMGWRGERR